MIRSDTNAKVVLVYPPSDKGRYEHLYLRSPKVGVGYVASSLEKAGISCSIIDAKFEGLSSDEVCNRLSQEWPDVIGISALTPEIGSASDLAAKIKLFLPQSLIVIGGVHAMILPKETIEENPAFDVLVSGEGELLMPKIVRAFREGQSFEHLDGVAFRRDGEVQVNKRMEYIKDVDSLPFPAWEKYPRPSYLYCLIASRGCPHSCAFCMTIMGKKVRPRSAKNVVDEMEWIVKKYQPREIIFSDETFTLNPKRTDEILEEILARGLERKARWGAQTRVDRIDLELLKKLKRAGCYRIDFGVESGNQEILKGVDKRISLQQVENAVAMAKKASLFVGCTFILGHPYETRKTIQDTINFLAKLNPNAASIGIMVPYPGTKVYEMAHRGEGNYRLLSSGWSDYMRFGGGGLEMKDIPRHDLEKYQVKAYLNFYFKNYRLKDFIAYGWEHREQSLAVLRKLFQRGDQKAPLAENTH